MAARPVKPLIRKKKSPFLLIIFLLLWGLSLFSQEKLPPLTPYKADIPPVMDGILDDPVCFALSVSKVMALVDYQKPVSAKFRKFPDNAAYG